MRRIGFPGIDVDVPGKPTPAFVQDSATLHALLGDRPVVKQLERKLRDAVKRWKDEAAKIGFTDAKKNEKEAEQRADRLARTALKTHATTLEGAIAKLEILCDANAPGPDVDEEPWPALRVVIADLKRLRRA